MKTVVCVKQVPSTNEVRLDPVTNTILRNGRQSVINPFDTYAIEQAVQIKEQQGGEVIVLSMGIPATERLLRDAESRGVDRAILLSDRNFAGADTLATAYTLSLGIKQLDGFDLILCGKMAVDGDTAQIGPELAENLGIPHITDVCEFIRVSEKEIICKKIIDNGHQILRVKLPALLTVIKGINMPRLPSIPGVVFGLSAPFEIQDSTTLNADLKRIGLSGSPTQVVKTHVPQRQSEAISIKGDITTQASEISKLIKEVL